MLRPDETAQTQSNPAIPVRTHTVRGMHQPAQEDIQVVPVVPGARAELGY